MILLLHACITFALVGLIWHVQVVQYPLFHRIGREQFVNYHFGHCFRIGLLIVPLLMAEFATAGWLLYAGERRAVFLVSLILMVLNWLSTAFFQAPIHVKLMRGYDHALVRRLILTNWLRTLAWTVRAGLLFEMLAQTLVRR